MASTLNVEKSNGVDSEQGFRPRGACFIAKPEPNQFDCTLYSLSIYNYQWVTKPKSHPRLSVVKVSVICMIFIRDELLPVRGQYCSRLVSRNQMLANQYGRVDLLVFLADIVCREETSPGEVRPESGYD